MYRVNKANKKQEVQLEAGHVPSTGRVWIGAPVQCYEEVRKPLTGRTLHVLHFTISQAEAVVEMLQEEIDRQKRKETA